MVWCDTSLFSLGVNRGLAAGSGIATTESEIECYTQAVRLNANHAMAHNNLGVLLRRVRADLAGAERAWHAALACSAKLRSTNKRAQTLAHRNLGEASTRAPVVTSSVAGGDCLGGERGATPRAVVATSEARRARARRPGPNRPRARRRDASDERACDSANTRARGAAAGLLSSYFCFCSVLRVVSRALVSRRTAGRPTRRPEDAAR